VARLFRDPDLSGGRTVSLELNRATHKITRVAATVTALCALAALAGCATDKLPQAQDSAGVTPDSASSPARDLLRQGFAEMVLTNRRWPSFEEASANRITSATSDSPLYAYIRTAKSLGELALPADPDGRYTFSAHPHLYLQVGDAESLQSLNTCYLTLAQEELALRELVVPLAPPALRPDGVPADCWIAATALTKSGRRIHEIRLAGFAGKYDGWLPQANLLAVATIPTTYTAATRSAASPQIAPPLQKSPPDSSPALAPEVTAAAPGMEANSAGSDAARSRPEPAVNPREAPQAGGGVQVAEATAPVIMPVPIVSIAPAPVRIASIGSTGPAPVPIVSTGAASVRIVIHHRGGDDTAEARARELHARLAARGKFDVELRPVTAPVAADHLRIFFESDRQTAQNTRELLASGPISIRDFSDYRPLPRPGTIELWLAATPSAGTTVSAASKPSIGTTGSTASTAPGRRAAFPSQPSETRRFDRETLRLLQLRQGN